MPWSGTGSFAVARGEAGEPPVGGRGYAFGGEGSGYDLVRRAIVGVLRAVDGRSRDGLDAIAHQRVRRAVAGALGAVAQGLTPAEVAARLPVVVEAFEAGDWLAADVLTHGLRQLVDLGEAAMRQAGLKARDGLQVKLGGGVLSDDVLRDGLLRLLQAALGEAVTVDHLSAGAAARGAGGLAAGWHQGEEPQRGWVDDVAL